MATAFAAAASAQPAAVPPARSLRSRGVFVGYDAERGSIAVRERGQVRDYSLLSGGEAGETDVVVEAAPARVSDLVPGSPVIVSWGPDPDDPSRRVAHAIEVPAIPRSYPDGLR